MRWMEDETSDDPRVGPHINEERRAEAIQMGKVLIVVSIADSHEELLASFTEEFLLYVDRIPRVGEFLELDDGSTACITKVVHNIIRNGQSLFRTTVTNVYALIAPVWPD